MPAACCYLVAAVTAAVRLLALLLHVASDSLRSAAAAYPARQWSMHLCTQEQGISRALVCFIEQRDSKNQSGTCGALPQHKEEDEEKEEPVVQL